MQPSDFAHKLSSYTDKLAPLKSTIAPLKRRLFPFWYENIDPLRDEVKRLDELTKFTEARLNGRGEPPIHRAIHGDNNVIIYDDSVRLDIITFEIRGSNNTIRIGSGTHVRNGSFIIHGDNCSITIGENVDFEEWILILLEGEGGAVEIGQHTTILKANLVIGPHSRLTIGEDCMMSYDIDIRTSDQHLMLDAETRKVINHPEDVSFGDHVWLGGKVTVLKGVHIASDSIIGFGALVTKSCDESGVVLAGFPAKVVKRGVTWDRSIEFPPREDA
ncbi:MAG: acyltransferase [Propionibacteriaceae bacterium]|jgi:acetyltransferase-like isoleucine patch superfamily enzyme|nr:acyltransferase [Propionibacteriaceae bacterium]